MRDMWAKSMAGVAAAFALALLAGCVDGGATPASSEPQSPTAADSAEQPSSTGVPGADPMPSGGALEPGRYYVERGPWTAQTYSFGVPAGWEVLDGGQTVTKYPGAPDLELGFGVFIVDELHAEPCGANQTIGLRQSSEALYMALRELPGLALSTPDYLAIGGRSGLYMEISVADGVDIDDCDPPSGLEIWIDRTGNNGFFLDPQFVTFIHSLDAERKRLLASEGELFVLVAWFSPNTDEEDIVELEAIIDSIAFVH